MFWWILIIVLVFALFTSKSDVRWLPVVLGGQLWTAARRASRRYCPSARDKRRAAGIYHDQHDDNTNGSTTTGGVSSTNDITPTNGITTPPLPSSSSSSSSVSSPSLSSSPSTSLSSVPAEPRGSRTPLGLPRVKATWQSDRDAPHCGKCRRNFTFTFRRHHCRVCKKIFCDPCSSQKYSGRRTCVDCFQLLQAVQNGTLKIKPKSAASLPTPTSSTSTSSSSSNITSSSSSGQAFTLGDSAPHGDEVKQELRRIRNSDQLKTWIHGKRNDMIREFKDDKLFKAEAIARKVLEALGEESKHLTSERHEYAAEWCRETEYKRIQEEVTQSRALMTELANNEGWQTVSRDKTAHTMSRKEDGKSLYSFKVVGDVRQPIWKITACIYEIDLFPKWFPFMAAARELKTVSRFRKFAQLTIRSIFPFDARDMVIDGYGVDFSEENKILVNVRSVEQSAHLDIPPPSPSTVRAFMHLGGFLIEPINEQLCRLSFMVNMDLKMSLPAWLLNTVSQKLIHVILGRIKQAANFDESNSEYAKRARANPLVYRYIQDAADAHFARMRGRALPSAGAGLHAASSSSSLDHDSKYN